MTTKIKKWGNSLAIRIPKNIAIKYGLKIDDEVYLAEKSDFLALKFPRQKKGKFQEIWQDYFILDQKDSPKENITDKIDEIVYGTNNR